MVKTATRKVSRRKLVVAQAYFILALCVIAGLVVGCFVGRLTTPKEVETVTKTVEIPISYSGDSLPESEEITYYDVPLSHSLQSYIYEVCADENVPMSLVIAMIEHESGFNPEVVSSTDDYGLMQINEINHSQLEEKFHSADMLNPYQNVFCGTKIIGSYIEKYEDLSQALMAYNMGEYGAKKAWLAGTTSTSYTESILSLMENYEQEVKENATASNNE